MPFPAPHPPHPKEARLHIAAVLYFLSRVALMGFVFAVPAVYFLRGFIQVPLVVGGAGLVAILFIGYYLAAAELKCAACSGPVLMDNGNQKHPHARRFLGLNPRARVAWDILLHTNYQCMYCQTRCRSKKSWSGAKSERGAKAVPLGAPRAVAEEKFPHSPFSNVEGLTSDSFGPGALPEVEERSLFGEITNEAFPQSGPAPLFPGVRTAPESVLEPDPLPPAAQSVRIAAMSPLEKAAETGTTPPAFTAPKPSSPVPWTVPERTETPPNDTAMHRQPAETPPTSQGPNPFLAAAAAMPPPPGPVLPIMSRPPAAPAEPPPFHHEFPFNSAAAPASDGPSHWTLPSMPAPQAPLVRHALAEQAPAAPAGVPVPALSADLLKDVIGTLEESRRTLTDAFQNLIVKLEASLGAALPAPLPPVVPVPEPVILQPVELPSLLVGPEPVILPREMTAPAPLPSMPAGMASGAPSPAMQEASAAATPRRRFARPSNLAAQQLSNALNQAFEPPSTPKGSGYVSNPDPAPPVTMPPPRAPKPESQSPAVPAMPPPPAPPRPPVLPQETSYSPFAVSSTPLSFPEGASGQPAPFTFLHHDGDHFAPNMSTVPGGIYDPLDDTALPWMQPLSGHASRN